VSQDASPTNGNATASHCCIADGVCDDMSYDISHLQVTRQVNYILQSLPGTLT
jgi:hypothetical protein